MKPITTDNFSFENMRRAGSLYVDKTQYVWSLVNSASSYYFLSRPRRFGKSLLLSTLKAFFQGKRELFEGLAIEQLAPADAWQEYPVVHLDMAQVTGGDSVEDLRTSLRNYLRYIAEQQGVTVNEEDLPQNILYQLLFSAYKSTGKPVVVLIDEYDKPILDALHKPQVEEVVAVMQSFYQVLKSNIEMERFVFVTGVSKFSHTSLFSGANNLTDLTQRDEYAAMLGYTEQELRDNFSEYIDKTAETLNIDREALVQKMKAWYDGFRFTSATAHVFNPVSVGKFFQNGGKFLNYWYGTGTPTFLIKQVKHNPFQLDEYTKEWIDPMAFEKADAINLDPFALAVQAGYLTIREVESDEMGEAYRYDFPNEEIRLSWYDDMIRMATAGHVRPEGERFNLLKAFRAGDTDKMMTRLQWIFSGVTKENLGHVHEGYYRNMLYLVFTAFGLNVHAEEQVAGGRVDLVAQGYAQTYVFELKVSKTDDEQAVNALLDQGLDQAVSKHYADKYRLDFAHLHTVAVVFEQTTHQLVTWKELH